MQRQHFGLITTKIEFRPLVCIYGVNQRGDGNDAHGGWLRIFRSSIPSEISNVREYHLIREVPAGISSTSLQLAHASWPQRFATSTLRRPSAPFLTPSFFRRFILSSPVRLCVPLYLCNPSFSIHIFLVYINTVQNNCGNNIFDRREMGMFRLQLGSRFIHSFLCISFCTFLYNASLKYITFTLRNYLNYYSEVPLVFQLFLSIRHYIEI